MQDIFEHKVEPVFRSKFNEDIFINKYKHDRCETWSKLSETLIEDVCNTEETKGLMSREELDRLTKYHKEMKFIGGGRYLYYAGRDNKFFNNCFDGNEKIYTSDGLKTFLECNQYEHVLAPSGNFIKSEIRSFGVQDVYRYTFSNVRGKSKKVWEKEVTPDHRWVLKDGTETTELVIGDVIPASGYANSSDNKSAIIHGMIFADGSKQEGKNDYVYQLRLCGDKSQYIDIFEDNYTITYPEFANGDPVVYLRSPIDFKELPNTKDPDYIGGFIYGWLSLDGHFGHVNQIHSINSEAIDWFVENAPYANLVTTGEKLVDETPSNFGERAPLYRINFKESGRFQGFKLINKKHVGRRVVYCAVVPGEAAFVMEGGMVTGNCYLLKSQDDTREDWANLSWKSENCLMTGGGIGNDYSIYRPRGSIISRTGGEASGPIPKMEMVNEIGRRVMQGGSRRSAIYASLNWKHADINDFLTIKNWDEQVIKGTGKSIAELKESDFNYPAPLDMTNISVNYDTEWLLNYWKTGDVGQVFKENAKQALKTAEPGFSFNFFDKENETLRNATG